MPVDQVRAWERGFQEHLAARVEDVLSGIREEKALSEELEKKLIAAIQAYNETFAALQESKKVEADDEAGAKPAPRFGLRADRD